MALSDSVPYDHMCTTCDEGKEASFYCKQCAKKFCDTCRTVHDEFLLKHSMLGESEVKEWGLVKRGVMCEKHGKHEIQMYCSTHDRLCCSVCTSVDCTRNSCKIEHISDLARGIHHNSELTDLPHVVNGLVQKLNEGIAKRSANGKNLKESFSSIKRAIIEKRELLIQKILDAEKNDLQYLEKHFKRLNECVEEDINDCANVKNELESLSMDIAKHGNENESYAYIKYKKCHDEIAQAENVLRKPTWSGEYGLSIYMDDINSQLASLKRLGSIHIQRPFRHTSEQEFTVERIGYYSVRINGDSAMCRVKGVCMLPNGTFVLSDSAEEGATLKLLDENFTVIDHQKMPEFPQDICHTTNMEVAVAITDWIKRFEIWIVRVNGHKFDTNNMLVKKLKHDCTGLSYNQGTLFVRSCDSVHMYKLNGEFIKSKKLHTSYLYHFNQCAVSVNNVIYTTNSGGSSLLICNNFDAVTALKIPDLKGACGVCVTSGGHVFVCSSGLQRIIQVNENGKRKVKTLVDRNCQPLSLCFDETSSRLIVGQDSDQILVATLKFI